MGRPRADHSLDAPQAVVGNIRFTRGGVYADYLIDGLPLVMRSLRTHERAARMFRSLGRELPSGWSLSGVLDATDPNRLMRNMVGRYAHRGDWVQHCRAWQPRFDPTADIDADAAQPAAEQVVREERRRGWLTIPVDSGRAGRTAAGHAERLKDWVIGRDVDSDTSVAAYRALADEVVSTLPDVFNVRAATPAQIQWHHRHNVFRGVLHEPIPPANVGPDSLDADAFIRPALDEGANQIRNRWFPTMRPIVRVYDADTAGGLASFQAFLVIERFPRSGLRFTRAAFLHNLDNIDTEATIDWLQNMTVRTPDRAAVLNQHNAKNIRDQMQQRGRLVDDDTELDDQLEETWEYTAEIKTNPSERELDVATVIAVGAASMEVLEDAVKQVKLELDQGEIAAGRWRGAQAKLWLAYQPGSERFSSLNEFRDPTTAHRWSRFTPLVSTRVGDATGSPLAINQTTLRKSLILHDPEGSALRDRNTGLAIVGDPGGGKSQRAKLSGIEVCKRGGRVVVFDPGTHGEWAQAFRNVAETTVIDPTRSPYSVDPLRMFDFETAGSVAADHILPMIGVPADDPMETRFTLMVRPEFREANGIGSMQRLISYLRQQPDAGDDELLARLEAWSSLPYARALFDETLPVYTPSQSLVTVWRTNALGLPDADDILNSHLYAKLAKRARAGMAIYGLVVDTEQRHMFARRDQYSTMIFEESAELLAYPAGARAAHRITRQGRKHATGIWLISQDYRDFARMGDKFITQKWLFAVRDEELAAATLQWAGIDPQLYPDVVESYCEDTSPAVSAEDEDVDTDGAGHVDPTRLGEGFLVDERGRRARVKFLGAPMPQMAADVDSRPPLEAA